MNTTTAAAGSTPHPRDEEDIKAKIVHILGIYPVISPTMLQVGLGPSLKPDLWRPALEELIEDGVVLREDESVKTPAERYNTYKKLRLAE